MVEQVTGAATATVIVLCWILIVECLTAGAVLLGHFIALKMHQLAGMIPRNAQDQASVARSTAGEVDNDDQRPRIILGGGLQRWE